MALQETNYPNGYVSTQLQKREFRKALKHQGGAWRDPIHGTWVFAAEDGVVLATVRTLGIMLPKKSRRYALAVPGVTFERIVPLLSRTRPILSDLAPYDQSKDALSAGTQLIERLRGEP